MTFDFESENDNKFEKIREKFFSFLYKKACTSGQAVEYLSRLEVPENFFDLLLNEAEELNLIDDFAYAKLFFDGHLSWGNAKIFHELSRKGVAREKIQEVLDDGEDESSRAAEIFKDLQKRGLDERKIINRLLSRGFRKIKPQFN